MYEILETSPMRSPCWRYKRVLHLLNNRPIPLRPRKSDDWIIKLYYTVLLRYLEAEHDPDLYGLLKSRQPDMVMAHQLHYLPQHEFCRQILEARLLADQPSREIGRRLGLTNVAVGLYEFVFFDVGRRLKNVTYIQKAVLAPPRVPIGAQRRSPGEIAKYLYRAVAYYGGVEALETVIGMSRSQPQNEAELADWLNGMLDETLSRRVAEQLFSADLDSGESQKMIKLALRLRPKKTPAKNTHTEDEMRQKTDAIIEAVVAGMHEREKEIYFRTRDGIKSPNTKS
jgi:hypothetical protein